MENVKHTSFSLMRILPIMFGFFVMGFVDIIGMANNYVKQDFSDLTDSVANLISLSCFVWFFLCAIPTSMLMNRIGRKKVVALSFCVTVLAMIVPLLDYSFATMLVTFSLVGIGNTILQVALNPLVTNVVSPKQLTGTLTLGQFVKAVSSFLGPIIVAWAAGTVYGWKFIFIFYAVTSLLAFVWLWLTPVPGETGEKQEVSFAQTLSLLKDPYILAFFLGIVVLVGVDVSINMTFPKLIMELRIVVAGCRDKQQRLLLCSYGGSLCRRYSADEDSRSTFLYHQYMDCISGADTVGYQQKYGHVLCKHCSFRIGLCQLVLYYFLPFHETHAQPSQ